MEEMYRQGDLLFLPSKLPQKGRTKVPHLVLVEGQATGHKHQVTKGKATQYALGATRYLSVQSATATVTHEEHGPIKLAKGTWEVRRQREFSATENRLVAD